MKRFQQILAYIVISFVAVIVYCSLSLTGLLNGLEQETLRWRYLARGELDSTAPILFVDLDAETVSYMGDRPWDRKEFAVLLEALLGPGQARVVSLDIILSKFGAGALLDLSRAREGDIALGQSVEKYHNKVVLASAYTGVRSSITDESANLPLRRKGLRDPEYTPFPEAPTFPIIKENIGRIALANVDEELSAGSIPYWVPAFVQINGSRYSLHLLDGAMRQLFHVLNEPKVVIEGEYAKVVDLDGWEPMVLPSRHELTLFSLGLETYLAANDLDARSVEVTEDALLINKDDVLLQRIPLFEEQSVEVNWLKGWPQKGSNQRVSMQLVIRKAHELAAAEKVGELESQRELEDWFNQFRDKVIFVGPVDPQLKDIAPTPFNREPVPKVVLHANLYRTLEAQAFITRIDQWGVVVITIGLTFFVALFSGSVGKGASLRRGLALLLFLSYSLSAYLLFTQLNWIIPVVAPMASALTASLGVVLIRLGSEEWEKRRIKSLFGAYLAPKLVEEMVDSGQDPKLGGTETEITALFSDVEGFSALSEELDPKRLMSLMNEYLSAMTGVFQGHSGTLDKYIGDAIVTMFGMPVPVEDHAARACLSAVAMQEKHAELREHWAQSGDWPEAVLQMRTRIGVNTGEAVIGNMGSEMRFNYTMMGDSVNLAARCESGAKTYGVYTMITASTLKEALAAGAKLNYRKLDRVVVKGRRRPVEVFELWDSSVSAEESSACRAAYEAGLEMYFSGDWSGALEAFLKAESFEPAASYAPTTPSRLMAARCRDFIEKGSPSGWDGAFRMSSK